MEFSNSQVADKLRNVAAAYQIKKLGNIFQVRAYEGAADAIEHLTSNVYDLWEEGKISEIPGIGETLQEYLNELFTSGKVKHWREVETGIPKQVFEFLNIPGVGPKTAMTLAKLGALDVADLKKKLEKGNLIKQGLSKKIAERILDNIPQLSTIKTGRMLLPFAFEQSQKILNYLHKSNYVHQADALGSLRRMVATIGDLDFSIASKNPKEAADYITSMPGISQIIDKGESRIALVLSSGIHLDFLIVEPESYGSLLQHFTGSKHHNIHLRRLAEEKGYSLSEYGVRVLKSNEIIYTPEESDLYKRLGMQTPPPEIREDTGEIEAALKHQLPQLIELKDIKGDLHIHSNFPLEPSHGPGVNSVEEILKAVEKLGYQYIGIADHPPSFTNHTHEQINTLIAKRSKYIEQINSSQKSTRVLNLLEVDILPNGDLSVPDEGLKMLDFALAGVHSAHNQSKKDMTKRILKALENPYVKVLTHPTGRLLNERSSYEADWEEIFKFAAKNKKVMEINAYPNRLDLPDALVRSANDFGVKFSIDTDSHELAHLSNMFFGVAVARRGWATGQDIVNSWDFDKFAAWFGLKK